MAHAELQVVPSSRWVIRVAITHLSGAYIGRQGFAVVYPMR
jgi:hypothetical protein